MEIVRLYKDENKVLWKGPMYCGKKMFFVAVHSSEERDDIDPSWIEIGWSFGMTLEAVNKFLRHTQLDIDATIVDRARQVAVEAHVNQTRWNGDAYVTHPMRVAASLDTVSSDDEQVVAYLHDVVEDTGLTLEMLRGFGFSPKQIDAVDSVTKRKNESYCNFIWRSKQNPVGRAVKIADIKDNLRDVDDRMRDKYELALWILEN